MFKEKLNQEKVPQLSSSNIQNDLSEHKNPHHFNQKAESASGKVSNLIVSTLELASDKL